MTGHNFHNQVAGRTFLQAGFYWVDQRTLLGMLLKHLPVALFLTFCFGNISWEMIISIHGNLKICIKESDIRSEYFKSLVSFSFVRLHFEYCYLPLINYFVVFIIIKKYIYIFGHTVNRISKIIFFQISKIIFQNNLSKMKSRPSTYSMCTSSTKQTNIIRHLTWQDKA